jgi:hypothetical protein
MDGGFLQITIDVGNHTDLRFGLIGSSVVDATKGWYSDEDNGTDDATHEASKPIHGRSAHIWTTAGIANPALTASRSMRLHALGVLLARLDFRCVNQSCQ